MDYKTRELLAQILEVLARIESKLDKPVLPFSYPGITLPVHTTTPQSTITCKKCGTELLPNQSFHLCGPVTC